MKSHLWSIDFCVIKVVVELDLLFQELKVQKKTLIRATSNQRKWGSKFLRSNIIAVAIVVQNFL